jgi:hypothetical protein
MQGLLGIKVLFEVRKIYQNKVLEKNITIVVYQTSSYKRKQYRWAVMPQQAKTSSGAFTF